MSHFRRPLTAMKPMVTSEYTWAVGRLKPKNLFTKCLEVKDGLVRVNKDHGDCEFLGYMSLAGKRCVVINVPYDSVLPIPTAKIRGLAGTLLWVDEAKDFVGDSSQ